VPISPEALFKIALNLEDPWYITTIDFSAERKQLDIYMDLTAYSRGCPPLQHGIPAQITGSLTKLKLKQSAS